MTWRGWRRLQDELAQAWNVVLKDVRVYYLTPPMLMFGLMMPFFMFFSFSVRREMAAAQGIARLLALTTFFTASSAGPVIIPLERRMGTYDRLLVAPMSLVTLLLGKMLVGTFFACAVSVVPLLVGWLALHVAAASTGMLLVSTVLASLAFSAFGLVFASIPTRSVGSIMMPSTLLRWPLMFISGVFIPLNEMAPWTRVLAHLSPLTYSQDLMNHAVLGTGMLNPWLDSVVLALSAGLFLVPILWMHQRSRRLGY
jgi:ABC-2 type transport system permease protein